MLDDLYELIQDADTKQQRLSDAMGQTAAASWPTTASGTKTNPLPQFKYQPEESQASKYNLGGLDENVSSKRLSDVLPDPLAPKIPETFPAFAYQPAGPLGTSEPSKGFTFTDLLPYAAWGLPLFAALAKGSSAPPPPPVHAPKNRPVPYKHVPSWLKVSQMPQSLSRGETMASYFWPGYQGR